MNKIREVITYKSYFDDFFREQTPKVRTKIIKVLDIIEQIERIPTTYLKYIEGTDGLFEIRVQLGNNIFRIQTGCFIEWFPEENAEDTCRRDRQSCTFDD